MKKILLAGSALLAAASVNPSLAADMAFKAPFDPGYSWSGCYIGAHGGGGFMKDDFSGGLEFHRFEGSSGSPVGYYYAGIGTPGDDSDLSFMLAVPSSAGSLGVTINGDRPSSVSRAKDGGRA